MKSDTNRAHGLSPIDAANTVAAQQPIEIWGGAEYTCNRVGDRYFDQMDLSGHAQRLSDFEEIAGLGIKTLRTGLLWERQARDGSWAWFDERLRCMQQTGIRPIAGLLHHGSGPRHTSLVDPEFPQKLAAYAGQVAERYPWIDAYTPVNEPHTTARFSGMYGVWYPHHRSRASCLRALLHQMKGTVLSMEAIRRVRPDAQLIQTDDLGRVSGTEMLRHIWKRIDLRRWLPFDLLCGRVDRWHPMFADMVAEGISDKEIMWFADHPCPPEVVGINYYVTSDRYLDDRVHLYPSGLGSSEGNFVDVETVRVHPEGISGFESLVLETWQRYGIPVAVTEVHLGGHVEEQIRWVAEAWEGVMRARKRGVECNALTIWALLGSFYWNKLVTCENGHYEAGVFDVSGGEPVATELAKVVAQIAKGQAPQHPALAHAGWWRTDQRICFPCAESDEELAA